MIDVMNHSAQLATSLCALVLGAAGQATAQKALAFDPKAYPSDTFQVTEGRYPLGDVTVRIVQARRKDPPGHASPPSFCRAWLEVRSKGARLKRLYYDDIEGLGGNFGIFVPARQPLTDYFVALKEGDYDGRLLLVARDGSLANLPGGVYFLTDDKRFIVGEHVMDSSSLTVVDVAGRTVVIDGEKNQDIPQAGQWYRDALGYFYTESEDPYPEGMPPERKGYVYRLDLTRFRIVKTRMSPARLAAAGKIVYEFQLPTKGDCTSPVPTPSPAPR
jgi:hypothetical protein